MENDDPRLATLLQAYLYAEGGTLSIQRLAQLTHSPEASVVAALRDLSQTLKDTGLSLVMTATDATLAVSVQESDVLAQCYRKELGREIGEAGLEVLAILIYRGASTRAQIDYIRGVNTTSTIRALLSRGLIMRSGSAQDTREFLYRVTPELLAHIGATSERELPEYVTIASELESFEAAAEPFRTDYERRNTSHHDGGADTVA